MRERKGTLITKRITALRYRCCNTAREYYVIGKKKFMKFVRERIEICSRVQKDIVIRFSNDKHFYRLIVVVNC